MNIVELMETDISKDLSTRASNILIRNGLGSIYAIILYKKKNLIKLRTMGPKSYVEIEKKLHSLNIDLDNEEKCKNMIKLYISEKINEMDNVVELIETTLTSLNETSKWKALNNALNTLSNYDYKTIYDLLKEKKHILKQKLDSSDISDVDKVYNTSFLTQYGCLVIALMKYGINLEDSESCEILLSYYEDSKKQKEIILKELEQENEQLQTTLDNNKDLLTRIRIEILRKKQLEQALTECDGTIRKLFAEYLELTQDEEKKYEK